MNKRGYAIHPFKGQSTNVEAKFVADREGILYFYDKEDQSDIDQPIAMFNKTEVKIIRKREEEK